MIEGFGNILVHKCWFPIEAIYYPMHDLDTFAEIRRCGYVVILGLCPSIALCVCFYFIIFHSGFGA